MKYRSPKAELQQSTSGSEAGQEFVHGNSSIGNSWVSAGSLRHHKDCDEKKTPRERGVVRMIRQGSPPMKKPPVFETTPTKTQAPASTPARSASLDS